MAGRTGLKKLLALLVSLPPPTYSVPLSVRKFPVFLSASSLTKPESEMGGVAEFVKVVLILEKHQDAHHDIKFASWAVGKEMRAKHFLPYHPSTPEQKARGRSGSRNRGRGGR